MGQSFVTSFGREIGFIDGYRERHTRKRSDPKPAAINAAPSNEPTDINSFVKDAFEYGMMVDFLENLGVAGPWARAIDIGGAEGTVARLLKADRMAQYAACIDILEMGSRLPTSLFRRHLRRIRMAARIGAVVPAARAALIGEGSFLGRQLPPYWRQFGYYPPPGSRYWRIGASGSAAIDRLIVGDVYDLNETFDLVTMLLCIPHFDLDRILSKVTGLLTTGGVFFFLSDYWWYPVNSTRIFGDFPYACQRLTRDDLKRYFEMHHPGELPGVLERYDYFHLGKCHPTIDEYIERAGRSGLSFLGARRLVPPGDRHLRAGFTPRFLQRSDDRILLDVLEDVRQVRPDVGLEDLHTAYIMMAFRKEGPPSAPLGVVGASERA